MKIRFTTPQTVANEQNGLHVRYAAAKRQLPRLRWYLLLLLVCLPLIYLATRILLDLWWEASPGFVAMPHSSLKAALSGRMQVLVHEGDRVRAGTLLARVQAVPAGAAPASLVGLNPALRQLDEGTGKSRASQGAALLRLMLEQRARMAQRLAVVNQLIGEGAATLAERQQAEAQLLAAQADVLRAQADVQGAGSALQRLQLQRQLDSQPAQAPTAVAGTPGVDLLAPADGTIVRSFALNQDWVAQGTELFVLQRQDAPEVRVFIHPKDGRNARLGARAELRFMDGGRAGASVVKIEVEAARTPPERVGPLASRIQSIVAVLKPDQPLPSKYRIADLPMDVRFERSWF